MSRLKIDVLFKLIVPCLRHDLYNPDFIGYDKARFFCVIDMVQKRKLYFHIFHSDIENPMGELNELCLYVFWILKLRPFYHKHDLSNDVNLKLAMTLFIQSLYYIIKKLRRKGLWTKDPNQVFTYKSSKHIFHAFKYQDISKEAIMLLAESMIGDH
jgi:hypothetical protein